MVTVCTFNLPVTDAAHYLGCVDRLSGGHSTTIIDSDKNTHRSAKATLRLISAQFLIFAAKEKKKGLYLDSTTPISVKSFDRCISCFHQPFIKRACYTKKQRKC